MPKVDLQFEYKLPTKAVHDWWTDLSGNGYVGESLKSVKPVGREGEKILIETSWHSMGRDWKWVEKLSLLSEDHWMWEPPEMFGFKVTDNFTLHDLGGGVTQLQIHSGIEPLGLKGKFINLVMGWMIKRSFAKEWKAASEACKRELASAPTA